MTEFTGKTDSLYAVFSPETKDELVDLGFGLGKAEGLQEGTTIALPDIMSADGTGVRFATVTGMSTVHPTMLATTVHLEPFECMCLTMIFRKDDDLIMLHNSAKVAARLDVADLLRAIFGG